MKLTPTLLSATMLLTLTATPLSTSHAILDKTRFVVHLGIAYYAFHHWDLQPYKAGKFSAGAPGRTSAMVKGGLALAFAAHEVAVAKKIADKSHDPLLMKLDASLGGLSGKMNSIGSGLKSGNLNPADLQSLENDTNSLSGNAAAGGQQIKDIATPIPGL
ncbi:hypothetical protein [Deinococcus ruber]|uniref:Uncharacterized protein n=1 Tax=Deinococcus ruber TaxID=1848197 RepID=A0A918CL27_9DEIO|nr:hypothetical protein [Deinococcus ruber]GGR28824.1 hypothetical protein GCM10008957_44910 [Deinococcus ruber]